MEAYYGQFCEIPPLLEELEEFTRLHMFKPEAPLCKFLTDNNCKPPPVFCPIHIIQDVKFICSRDGHNLPSNVQHIKPGSPAKSALGGRVTTVQELKQRVMVQLAPLTECHAQPIYDFLTGNYYNYHAPVRIPPRLAEL
jgi:hypothetical protein